MSAERDLGRARTADLLSHSMAPSGAKDVRHVISGGLEPPTFCVLDRCDDHYTTRSRDDVEIRPKHLK
uniref:Uncharacterized protein n=1 Tax=Ascaris lumbricoides TaxID=6252 RepID=A0A0M3IMV5_ASCLU